jgi:hypothetical protein
MPRSFYIAGGTAQPKMSGGCILETAGKNAEVSKVPSFGPFMSPLSPGERLEFPPLRGLRGNSHADCVDLTRSSEDNGMPAALLNQPEESYWTIGPANGGAVGAERGARHVDIHSGDDRGRLNPEAGIIP